MDLDKTLEKLGAADLDLVNAINLHMLFITGIAVFY